MMLVVAVLEQSALGDLGLAAGVPVPVLPGFLPGSRKE